ELALHAPGLGYYSAGACKIGADGDFVTAPELGRLFGRTLARQVAQLLHAGITDVIELGAGSGRLARDLLEELVTLDCLPQRYLILETSADLRERQSALLQRELPQLASRLAWLDALPAACGALFCAHPGGTSRARRRAADRLRLSGARILSPAAQQRNVDVPLPPAFARGPVLPHRVAGHYRARRLQRHCECRGRVRTRFARLHEPGSIPDQLRHHRCVGQDTGRRYRGVSAARRAGTNADEPRGDGRVVQGY